MAPPKKPKTLQQTLTPQPQQPQQRMVPPPPPYVPTMPQTFNVPQLSLPLLQPGAQMPQRDFGLKPVAAPQPTISPDDINGVGPDPSMLMNLRNALTVQQGALGEAQDRMRDYEPLAMPQMQTTAFDDMMRGQLQNKITHALAGGDENTYGGRFDRGFDMGQRIASSLVVPAIGAFSGGGGALGALQATEGLKRDVKESRAARIAEKSQNNQILANLASLYENVSPTSAKNLSALMANQLQVAKFNNDLQRQGYQDVNGAATSVANTAGKIADLNMTGTKEQMGLRNNLFNQQNAVAQFGQQQNAQQIQAVGQQGHLEQGAQNLQLQRERMQMEANNFAKNFELHAQELAKGIQGNQVSASTALMQQARLIQDHMTAINANGTAKYPDYASYLKGNPAVAQSLGNLAKAAGLNVTPEEIMNTWDTTGQQQQPQGGGDWLGGLLQAGGNAANAVGGAATGMINGIGNLLTPKAAQSGRWQDQFAQPPGKTGYLTPLPAPKQASFEQWLQANQNVPAVKGWLQSMAEDPKTVDYDLPGWFEKTGGKLPTEKNQQDHEIHFEDRFKTPYHMSFSRESKYAKENSGAPYWNTKGLKEGEQPYQLVGPDGKIYLDERVEAQRRRNGR